MEWISVKDRLPTDGALVLVVYHGVVQFLTYAYDSEKEQWNPVFGPEGDEMPASFVTHWQPLPDPPR